jgi:hypothetical protein
MFLHTAAVAALLDMKPATAKNFTNLILTLTVGSASFSSHQNICLSVVGVVCCKAEVSATS